MEFRTPPYIDPPLNEEAFTGGARKILAAPKLEAAGTKMCCDKTKKHRSLVEGLVRRDLDKFSAMSVSAKNLSRSCLVPQGRGVRA